MQFLCIHLIIFTIVFSVLGCNKDEDCQLNGQCINKICQCDSGWAGDTCGVLDLIPAPINAGFRQNDTWSWGGTILSDTNGFYLYVSEMGNHCCLDCVWRSNSQIVHTMSPSGHPTGPYSRVSVAISPEAHNPQGILAPDGTYLLFDSYGGPVSCPTKTNLTTCSTITNCPCTKGLGQFTFHHSSSPLGPWDAYTVPMPYPCYSCNLTPAPLFHPNGTLFIIFHCDRDNTHQTCDLTMVRAEHWKGPYTMVKGGAPVWQGSQSPGHPEDPFLWLDKHGNWHILLHNGNHGIHIYSRDGLNFTVANNNNPPYPFTTAISTESGILNVARRERPWMHVENGTPLLLVTSVYPNRGITYTHVQAFKGMDKYTSKTIQ